MSPPFLALPLACACRACACVSCVRAACVASLPILKWLAVLRRLKRLLGHATLFVNKRDSHSPSVQGSRDIPVTVAAMSLDELRDEVVRLASADTGGMASPDEAGSEADRAAMEEQVLTELASHPTVTYVRALEEEREGYRDALQVETKRTRDQRVALEVKHTTFHMRHATCDMRHTTHHNTHTAHRTHTALAAHVAHSTHSSSGLHHPAIYLANPHCNRKLTRSGRSAL